MNTESEMPNLESCVGCCSDSTCPSEHHDEKPLVEQLPGKTFREKSASRRRAACRLVSTTESGHAQPMSRPAHL
jgi:hypothetical protein